MLLDAAPPTVQFGGSAKARVSASGEVVRTTRERLSGYALDGYATGGLLSTGGGCVFDGTHFVAISNSGGGSAAHYSTNGTSWTQGAGNGVEQWLNGSVGFTDGNGTVMAILQTASTTKIRKSTDHGATWVATGALPSASAWTALGYGAGVWVATVDGGTATARSIDGGATWSSGGTLATAINGGVVLYGNGVFLAVSGGNNNTFVSKDLGLTWSQQSTGGFGRGMGLFHTRSGMFILGNDWQGFAGLSPNGKIYSALPVTFSTGNGVQTYVNTANGYIYGNRGAILDFDLWTGVPISTDFAYITAYGNGVYVGCANYSWYKVDALVPVYDGVTE